MIKLIGPFKQLLRFAEEPLHGALSDGQLTILGDAGIVCDGSRIRSVGNYDELRKQLVRDTVPHELEYIAYDAVGLPGLIDAHTHICFAGDRAGDYALRNAGKSYLEIASQGGGIWDTVRHTRAASREELVSLTLKRIDRLIKQGVTTVEIKSGYGLSVEEELKMLRAINDVQSASGIRVIPTCLAAHIVPRDQYNTAEEYLHHVVAELFPIIKTENLTGRIDAFVEKEAFVSGQIETYLNAAAAYGFDITIHADQFTPIGVPLAVRHKAVSADHLEASDDHSIRLIARSETVAVALPGASMGLGCAFAPTRKLLDAGACVAIASDWNPGSAPMGDLLCQAAVLGAFEKMTNAEVLAGITYRAAHALRLSDCGRLMPDYRADIVVFPTDDYRQILYHQGQMRPCSVYSNGIALHSN